MHPSVSCGPCCDLRSVLSILIGEHIIPCGLTTGYTVRSISAFYSNPAYCEWAIYLTYWRCNSTWKVLQTIQHHQPVAFPPTRSSDCSHAIRPSNVKLVKRTVNLSLSSRLHLDTTHTSNRRKALMVYRLPWYLAIQPKKKDHERRFPMHIPCTEASWCYS